MLERIISIELGERRIMVLRLYQVKISYLTKISLLLTRLAPSKLIESKNDYGLGRIAAWLH